MADSSGMARTRKRSPGCRRARRPSAGRQEQSRSSGPRSPVPWLSVRRPVAPEGPAPAPRRPGLNGHFLLRRRFQRPGGCRFAAQALHRRQAIRLLAQKGVAELLRPVELLRHHLEDARKRHQRFDARVPALPFQRLCQRIAFERCILRIGHPARRHDDLERISGGRQDLDDQLVRIERDRRQDLVELLGFERRCSRLFGLSRRRLWSELRSAVPAAERVLPASPAGQGRQQLRQLLATRRVPYRSSRL